MTFLRNADNRRLVALKTRVATVLTAPPVGGLVDRLTGGVVPAYGLRIDTRSPAVSHETRAQLLWRLYEGAEVRLARRYLSPASCVVDLGASLGVLGAVATRATGAERYLGVEANPALLEAARRNLATNAPRVDPTLVHGAIDYLRPAGSTTSFDSAAIHTGASLVEDVGSADFSAPVVRLGQLVEEHAIDAYTLLMDIEGAETGLFLDDPAGLDGCRQMLVELHDNEFRGRSYRRDEVLELALALGFGVTASYGSVYVLDRT